MSGNTVLSHLQAQVLYLTVNRPDKLNALNAAAIDALSGEIADARGNQNVRAVVITGAGDKAFVAGADIAELRNRTGVEARELSRRGQRLMSNIETLGKPVIAAVNGYALGGGCELALACTLRIAAENALFGLPEINLGIMPGYGGTQRLARLVGRGRAMEMALTGRQVTADEALRVGLVHEVAEPGQSLNAAAKLASRLAESAPIAMQAIMDAINTGSDLTLSAGLEIEADRFGLCCSTEDAQEGTGAFLEKRKAQFRGR